MILSQGAEAIIELIEDKVHKKRIKKTYRHENIDNSLRSSRTKREIKVIKKLQDLNINVPKLFPSDDKFTIIMEYIDGKRLRDSLIEDKSNKKYLELVGEWLATMHNNDIMHGDLTTSNIILNKENKLYLIDFGLSFFSKKFEDMAVDIHLLKQAIESTHYQHQKEFYKIFKDAYKKHSNYTEEVFKRLEKVESRGRNKK